MMMKVIIFVVLGCLLGQANQCFCDAGCADLSATAAVEAPMDACSSCCHSEQKQARDDPGSCNCLGCRGAKPLAEAISPSSPAPELRTSPVCFSRTCLPAAPESESVASLEVTQPPGPPVYLLFEVLLT